MAVVETLAGSARRPGGRVFAIYLMRHLIRDLVRDLTRFSGGAHSYPENLYIFLFSSFFVFYPFFTRALG